MSLPTSSDWKRHLLERSSQILGDSRAKAKSPDTTAVGLKIADLALKNDFFEKVLTKAGMLSARQ